MYHGRDGLLAGVVVSGGVVPDHLSVLDVHTLTDTVDLRTHGGHIKVYFPLRKVDDEVLVMKLDLFFTLH